MSTKKEVTENLVEVAENTAPAETDRKAQLEDYLKRIQKDYQDLEVKEKNCDSTINELKERVLRQEEAKNIITAQKLQLENTFRAIQAELQQIK